MTHKLAGSVTGSSHADLRHKAEETSATYFGTTCVVVALGDAELLILESAAWQEAKDAVAFMAAYTAFEQHEIPARGLKCLECGEYL